MATFFHHTTHRQTRSFQHIPLAGLWYMYNDVLQYWLKQFNNTLKLPIQTNSTTLLALPLSALQFRRPAGVSQSLSQAHSFQHTTHRQTRSCQLITPDTPVHSNTSPPDRHINSNTSTLDRPVLHYNTPCRRVHSNNHPLAHPIIPTNHPLIDPFIPTHHLLIEPLIPTHHLLIEPLIPTHHPLTHPFIQTHYPVTNPFISTHRPPPRHWQTRLFQYYIWQTRSFQQFIIWRTRSFQPITPWQTSYIHTLRYNKILLHSSNEKNTIYLSIMLYFGR